MKICFFDFDGTLFDSPTPDTGKELWSKHHGKPYPHIGWWSKFESLDTEVFDFVPKEPTHSDYLKVFGEHPCHLLTSRMPKFESVMCKILHMNNIAFNGYHFASSKTKGERIDNVIENYALQGKTFSEIHFWEDRNKEIVTVEALRDKWKISGIDLHIHKIQSDAID